VNAWKVILATLVIFIAGVLTGGLLVILSFKVEHGLQTKVEQALQSPPVRPNKSTNGPNNPNAALATSPWQVRIHDLIRRMDRELDLTPGQRQQIEGIIGAGQERMRILWKPIAPQMNHEMQFVNSQIREVLTPEQKAKFDEFPKTRAQPGRHNMTNSLPGGLTNSVATNAPAIP